MEAARKDQLAECAEEEEQGRGVHTGISQRLRAWTLIGWRTRLIQRWRSVRDVLRQLAASD